MSDDKRSFVEKIEAKFQNFFDSLISKILLIIFIFIVLFVSIKLIKFIWYL